LIIIPENALLICATNHAEIIDTALLRRFQLKINYEMPSAEFLDTFYDQLLSQFPENMRTIERKYSISFAEAKDHALTSVKAALIKNWKLKKLPEHERRPSSQPGTHQYPNSKCM
jgi:AAA+ superfamily predicted ATPase